MLWLRHATGRRETQEAGSVAGGAGVPAVRRTAPLGMSCTALEGPQGRGDGAPSTTLFERIRRRGDVRGGYALEADRSASLQRGLGRAAHSAGVHEPRARSRSGFASSSSLAGGCLRRPPSTRRLPTPSAGWCSGLVDAARVIAVPASSTSANDSLSSELERLADLRERGLLDDEEFRAARNALLRSRHEA